jgi:hypothetical protein
MKDIIVKLITGEEVIGKIKGNNINFNNEFFDIEDPMNILYVSDTYGNMAMKMRKYVMCSEESTLSFRTDDVITYSTPRKAIVEYYRESIDYSNSLVESVDHAVSKSKEYFSKGYDEEDEELMKALLDSMKSDTTIN